MRPIGHVAASGLISVFVGMAFRSPACAVASFIAGVFIDIDHVVDYSVNNAFTLNLRDIYRACLDPRSNFKRLYLFFHSYELIFLLWLAIYVFSLSDIWKAIAIGITQHIILDQITNPVNTFGYFLAYRLWKNFKTELIIHKVKGATEKCQP